MKDSSGRNPDLPISQPFGTTIDYCPEPFYLLSKTAENSSWNEALSELIDNAFDANANRCEITINKDRVIVSDDGIGCDDLARFIKLGKRRDHSSTSLGMHGRGVKDAWFWLGDRISVRSYHANHCHSLSLRMTDLIQSNWTGDAPSVSPSIGRGTHIEFSDLHNTRRAPREHTLDDLGKTYMPALMDGRQIIVKCGIKRARRIKPFVMPLVQDVIRDVFEVNGKSVAIDIGIVPEGQLNPVSGLMYILGYRVIMNCAVGAGEYSVARLAGTVTLGKGWHLSPHKDNISESIDELGNAIYQRINHIVERAHHQAITAECAAFIDEVEGLTEEGLKQLKKEKRNKGESHPGAIKPKNSGRKRKKAAKVQDGDGSVEGPNNGQPKKKGIKIDANETGSDDTLGRADPVRNRVTLNLSHPFVRAAWDARNVLAVYSTAFGIYCHDRCRPGKQGLLVDIHDYLSAWGISLKTGKWQGGHPDGEII